MTRADAIERRWAIRLFKKWICYVEAHIAVALSQIIKTRSIYWPVVRLDKWLRVLQDQLAVMEFENILELHGDQSSNAW